MKNSILVGLMLLAAVRAWAANPAFIQSRSAQSLGTNTVSATFGSNNDPSSDGDHAIVVLARWGNDSGTIAVTDTAGNTYHQVVPAVWDSVRGGQTLFAWLALGIVKNAASNHVTVTITGAGNHLLTIAMLEYSHIATSNAMDVSSISYGGQSLVSPITCPAVTTTTAGDVVVALIQSAPLTAPATSSFGAGFTSRENSGSGDGWVATGRGFVADDVGVPIGTYTPSFSWTGGPARGYGAITFALRGAGAR